jgi:hypothetical protein
VKKAEGMIANQLACNDSVMLSQERNQTVSNVTQKLEYMFSFMCLIAGAMAIFLEKNWFKNIND